MTYTSLAVIFVLTVLLRMIQSTVETEELSVKLDKNILNNSTFPENFLFGVSISALGHEGAWNVSDKGESVWDYLTHANPALVQDGNNTDVTSDFYHKYKEDLRLARSIGSQMFRISFSWPRILPDGFTNHVSKDGVQFYQNVLDEIAANGMIPMVVLFEDDLPYKLQKMGGLSNPLFVDWFEQYARFVFVTFGDRVKHWLTINEPNFLCYNGYGDIAIPFLNLSGIADYLCGHHALLAHARAYHLYDREFRPSQKGQLGYSINFQVPQPADMSLPDDIAAAEKDYQWFLMWLVHPVFSSTGDYINMIKEDVANRSRLQGFSKSRLPSFTEEQIREVRGASDFLGINYYTYELVTPKPDVNIHTVSFDADNGLMASETVVEMKNSPSVFRKLMLRLQKEFRPMLYITENGFPEAALEDKARVAYLREHIAEVLKAIQEGVDVRGYLLWSLMDGFERQFGYQLQYGLFHVDFKNPNLTRTPRLSTEFVARVYKTRRLD